MKHYNVIKKGKKVVEKFKYCIIFQRRYIAAVQNRRAEEQFCSRNLNRMFITNYTDKKFRYENSKVK